MCIIIVKQDGKAVPTEVIKTSSRMNPHGLGVVWLDTFEVTYHKSNEYKHLITDRPFIAHFRYATVGKVGKENTHPFVCGNSKHELLMMNGTIYSLGNENECDTKVLARELGDKPRKTWADELGKHPCRFVTVNKRNRTFQLYNKHLWYQKDGVWYSKDNVFEDNLVAVYGTLKRGNGNYNRFLSDSKFVGKGVTKDKYPLMISGLPYLIDKKGTGHNVEVEVFKVSREVMFDLDALEGHPTWYQRKQVDIVVGKGKKERVLKCWVYFNGNEVPSGTKLHKTYSYTPYNYKPQSYTHSQYSRAKMDNQYGMTYQDELSYEYEELHRRHAEEAFCVNCYSTLQYDGFLDYYCRSCEEWFCTSEVVKV
jgi:gamma-glutamylcyclotransferase (GGCT)/AIG2-like uncharacterized protein YtfP